jgi:hypothetical protein
MSNRSSGSKLGAIAGLVILVAFFLPWVRACDTDLTGYDLATDETGRVEDPDMYWAVPIAGLACMALLFVARTNTAGRRIRAAFVRLVVGVIGFIPVVNIWVNVRQKEEDMEILYGGWVLVAGFCGILLSFLMDLGSDRDG